MTPVEIEQIAMNFRAKGLHSSWNELIEFSNEVVAVLVEAYQTLLKDSASLGIIPSANTEKTNLLVQDRLAKALISLTSPTQVARWESEVLGSSRAMPATDGTSLHDNK